MKRHKIAHLINSIGLGGVPAAVYHLLKNLPPDRYDLFLYLLKRPFDHPEVREEIAERFRRLGVRLFFPERDEKKFHVVADLCRWILRDRIDLLHTHSYKPNLYGRLAGLLCKQEGLKIVAHYHNQYDDKWERDGSLIYDRLLAQSSDRLIACSESVRSHVSKEVEVSPERIDLILNGADLDPFRIDEAPDRIKAEMGIPLGRKIVGMVGRLSEQKGQDDFVRAAKIILQHLPETLFLIVGAPDEPVFLERMQQLTRTLGIEKEVRFVGYVSEMPRVYRILDLLVVPSRWEGFGLVLVEGMAAGKPIVATNVGAIPEVVIPERTARLVPPNAPAAIAEEVLFLLQHPDLAKAMGEEGLDRAKRFSWQASGNRLDELYQRLLKGSRK